MSRREEAAAAATEILAKHGARGLTHREVDRHLGWPLGSTSNYFRKRIDLFAAISERIIQLDRSSFSALNEMLARPDEITLERFTSTMVDLVLSWHRPSHRSITLAGAELLLECSRNPAVQKVTQLELEKLQDWYRRAFKQLGSPDPVASMQMFSVLISSLYVGVALYVKFPNRRQLQALVKSWASQCIKQVM